MPLFTDRETPEVVAQACRFATFHGGRCALCGAADASLIADHDHQTGSLRGYLCASCNAGEGNRHNALLPVFVSYRRCHPSALLDFHERYSPGGVARSFLNARLKLITHQERQIVAVRMSLDVLRRQMVKTGRPTMVDFASRIGAAWGRIGGALGPEAFVDDLHDHLAHLLFYLDIVEGVAEDEKSAWDWLVGRSTRVARRACWDLKAAQVHPT
jgi:hypothetical protein